MHEPGSLRTDASRWLTIALVFAWLLVGSSTDARAGKSGSSSSRGRSSSSSSSRPRAKAKPKPKPAPNNDDASPSIRRGSTGGTHSDDDGSEDSSSGAGSSVKTRKKVADERNRAAVAARKQGDFESAVAGFREAFTAHAHPKIASNAGRALLEWSRQDGQNGDPENQLAHLRESRDYLLRALVSDRIDSTERRKASYALREVNETIRQLNPAEDDGRPLENVARPKPDKAARPGEDSDAVLDDVSQPLPRRPDELAEGGDAAENVAPRAPSREQLVAQLTDANPGYAAFLRDLQSELGVPKLQAYHLAHRANDLSSQPGNYQTVATLLRHALLLNPDDHDEPKILNQLGSILLRQGDKNGAWQVLIEVMGHDCANEDDISSAFVRLEDIDFNRAQDVYEEAQARLRDRMARKAEEYGRVAGAAKLQREAYLMQPTAARAVLAARYFETQKDYERAARMHRAVLMELATATDEPDLMLRAESRAFLADFGFDGEPKFRFTQSVAASYTKTQRVTERTLEEDSPHEDVWNGLLKPWFELLADRKTPDVYREVRKEAQNLLGPDADVDEVVVQGLAEVMARGRKMGVEAIDNLRQQCGIPDELFDRLGNDPQGYSRDQLETMQKLKVKYLKSTAEREPFLVHGPRADGGALVQNGKPLDTSKESSYFSGLGHAIFVMSPDGQFYVGSHRVNAFHHSSFLAGEDVASAGEIQAKNGRIVQITNKSGHYKPQVIHLVQALQQLRDVMGQDLTGVKVRVFATLLNGKVDVRDWPDGYDADHFLKKYEAEFLGKPMADDDPYNDGESFTEVWRRAGFSIEKFDPSFDVAALSAAFG